MRELALWAILSAAATAACIAAIGAAIGAAVGAGAMASASAANAGPGGPNLVATSPPLSSLDDRDRQRCPPECYCLSNTQVLCNTGGLTRIPLESLPKQVRSLSVSRSDLLVIKTDAFNGLRNLTILSLDECNVTSIRAFAFRGLSRLKQLSIEHTPLEVVSSFAFAGLHELEMIRLSNNRIHTIEGEAFAGSSHINLLLLNQNPMRLLKSKAFSGLADVKHLVVPSGIAGIQADAFNGLDHVGVLKLAYMDLPSLDANTFRGLSHVHYLHILHSDLGVIRKDVFFGLSQVLNLFIQNNKIDAIEEFRVLASNKIGNVHLIGNHLLENPDPGAISIQISGNLTVKSNSFPCDCRLRALLHGPLANGSSRGFRSRNSCIKPLGLNGRNMAHVDLEKVWQIQECPSLSDGRKRPTNSASPPSSGLFESAALRKTADNGLILILIFLVLGTKS